MTDLETACRELVEKWGKQADHLASQEVFAKADGLIDCAEDLERALEEHTDMDPEVKTLVEQMEDAT